MENKPTILKDEDRLKELAARRALDPRADGTATSNQQIRPGSPAPTTSGSTAATAITAQAPLNLTSSPTVVRPPSSRPADNRPLDPTKLAESMQGRGADQATLPSSA